MTDIRSGVESIFSYIARTAEMVDGGYRWRTLNYADQPQYHFCIFNGVAGIALFLRDYYLFTEDYRALDLARGALRWCECSHPVEGDFQRGVYLGRTGVAYAQLYLAEFNPDESVPEFCQSNASRLLDEPPGPVIDFLGGEASNGWYLLKLWEKTGDDRHLQGAVRCGSWISEHLTRNELGTHCLIRPDGGMGTTAYLGLSHGIAGVAYFYSLLHRATRDEQWLSIARELLNTLIQHATPAKGGLNWAPTIGGSELSRCQYSHGASGIGLVFCLLASVLEDTKLLAVAERAGEAAYRYGDFRSNPTLCTGVAGSGQLFVELFRATGDSKWRDRAREFARMAIAYKSAGDGGDEWPTDTAGLSSPDYTYGAAGTGHFLLRALHPHKFSLPLF
ncbi:MAG: lanthionine synthetase LanC family protein [Chthoniobacterales bacterium]